MRLGRALFVGVMGLGMVLCCNGCMTPVAMFARAEDPVYGDGGPLYPATCLDGALLFDGYWNGKESYLKPSPYLAPLTVVDLPLAVATDTVFLPYDAYVMHKWQQKKEGREQAEPDRQRRRETPASQPATAPVTGPVHRTGLGNEQQRNV